MDCRISFVARGKGKIYSYVYPGTALSEDGSTNDTGKSYSLKNQWEKYTYTFRTISNMYGDPTKTLIFRCQANDDVEFELDKGSVIIEKVQGAKKLGTSKTYNKDAGVQIGFIS